MQSTPFLSRCYNELELNKIFNPKLHVYHINKLDSFDTDCGDIYIHYVDNNIKEDVFEAINGVIEIFIDSKLNMGMGNAVTSNILNNLFNNYTIIFDLNQILDSTTKLKEIFDQSNFKFNKNTKKQERIDSITRKPNIYGKGKNLGLVKDTVVLTLKPDGILGPNINVIHEFQSDFCTSLVLATQDADKKALDYLDKIYNLKWL